jgi:CheY-like chemotaxis protein
MQALQRSARVLVIDDEIVVLALIRAHLEAEGYVVETAEDGMTGLEQARRLLPDAIICDVVMPRLDGFRLLAELRRDPRTAAIPVALLTGLSGDTGRQRAAAAGAEAVLIKPLDRGQLLAAVHALVGGRGAASGSDGQAPQREPDAPPAASARVARRHAALLLCENRGSGGVGEFGGPAAALDTQRARIYDAVLQYDGRIANTGDSLLVAMFESPPKTLPDYAGRAVGAALQIMQDTSATNTNGIFGFSGRDGKAPALGIALHLGEVAVGEPAAGSIGGRGGGAALTGDTMTVALELLRHGREMRWPIAASAALARAAGKRVDVDNGAAVHFVVDGRAIDALPVTGNTKTQSERRQGS